jgi:NAD(P)-dependent dehydrogenase (short-subunit alcohol dehydrogenase family)
MAVGLTGHAALVTGGSRGVGRAIADALAAAGAAVHTFSRSTGLDVTDREAVERAVAALGAIDLLVNNAGTLDAVGPVWEVDPEDWRRDLESSLLGTFHCCRAVLPGMIERGSGRIVNVSSGVAGRAYPYGSGYAAAKAGLVNFTQTLAAEASEHGLAVFAISPGFVWTAMTERLRDSPEGRRWFPGFGSSDPNEPERAGELVVRLASGEADALSGRYIHVRDDLDELLNERR